MAATYEYIIRLTDQMSGTMQKVTGTSDAMVNRLESMTKRQRELSGMSKNLSGSIFGLKQRIDLLQQEKELIDPDNLDFIKKYNKEINHLEGQLNRLDNAGKPRSFLSGITDNLKGLINPATITAAVTAASGKAAMNFEEGMAKVNVTAQFDEADFSTLKDRIKSIAKDNKAVIELAPAGFEQILSQTDDVGLSLEVLDAAFKGARGGFTDLTTVSAALAQSMSVIGKENTTAIEVLDTFLAAKRVGAGEFADFARYLPTMIAGASNLGIAYKEVAGTYAYMTGKGQSAEKAAVLMENAFSVLGKGDIRDNLKKAGVAVFDSTGKVRGLVDVFGDLTKVMGSFSDEQKSTFLEKIGIVDKEAKNAFALLTSDMQKYSESMDETVNSAGETEKALKFSENTIQKATDLWTKLRNIGFQFGNAVLPLINSSLTVLGVILSGTEPVLSAVASLFDWWFSSLETGNPLVYALTAALVGETIAVNAATIATKTKVAWDWIVSKSTKAWASAQALLNAAFWASPITWIIAGVAALVGVITMCITKVEGWGRQWEVVVSFMKSSFNLYVETIKLQWGTLIHSLMMGLDKIRIGWHKFREALGLGNAEENRAMIEQLNTDVEKRKEAITEGARRVKELAGKTASSLSWELSWKKEDKRPAATEPQETVPEASVGSSTPVDFDKLLKGLEKTTGKGKGGKETASKINLNDTIDKIKGSTAYTAIASKLNPVKIDSLSNKTEPQATFHELPDSLALEVPSDASVTTKEVYRETERTERGSIRIDRFCDQVVIHISEMNDKGRGEIQEEVQNCLMELFDDYGA